MKKITKSLLLALIVYLGCVAFSLVIATMEGREPSAVWNEIKTVAAETVTENRKRLTGDENSSPSRNIPQVSARQAVLTDSRGKIIFEKNAQDKAYPASTTKILTVLVALEIMEKLDSDLKQKVQIPAAAVGKEGSSIYLKAGERIKFVDLLYGAMLRSGNDAATAIAIITGGTEEHFVKLMNQKARQIGCSGSHFTNPTGLFDENHYTTAEDMAKIARIAMKKPVFRKIAATEQYTAQRGAGEYNCFYNKNKTVHQYEGGNGIKIGFTKKTGRTLVASAKRGQQQMICVVFGDPDWFEDAYRLMDFGFSLK